MRIRLVGNTSLCAKLCPSGINVFDTFLVFVSRYAAFYCGSSYHLFNLLVQIKSNTVLSTTYFGMCRMEFNHNGRKWIEKRVVCGRKSVEIVMVFEFDDFNYTYSLSVDTFESAYIPTHLRFTSWMTGVIAGYIFLKYQNRPIHIPRVNYFHLFSILFFFFIWVNFI